MVMKATMEADTELSHQQLLDAVLGAIADVKVHLGKLSEKLTRMESAQDAINARLDRIDKRLAEGDRRMTEQDKSLVLQSSVIRTASQLKDARKKLDAEIEQLEKLELEARLRISPPIEHDPEAPTSPGHPKPERDTMPAPSIPPESKPAGPALEE